MTTHDIDNLHYCGICFDYFGGVGALRGHMTTHHGHGLTCHMCPTSRLVPTDIRAHMREVHKHESTHICTCCLDVFLLKPDRERHEGRHEVTRPDIGTIATSRYPTRSLTTHVTVRRHEFAEHYARQICAFYVSRRRSSEYPSIEIFHKIIDMHLEVTFPDSSREEIDRRRTALFNKAMASETASNRTRISDCLSHRQQAEQDRVAPNTKQSAVTREQQGRTEPTTPAMNPNTDPMNQAQGHNPSMYADLRPQTGHHQPALPQQQGFDVPMNQPMNPNAGPIYQGGPHPVMYTVGQMPNQGQFQSPTNYGMGQPYYPPHYQFQQVAPTMNPSAVPMYPVQGGPPPAMYGVPNQGQWAQQPDYPDQLQQVDPRQAQEVPQQQYDGQNWGYGDWYGTGPSTSQQNFGPPDQQQYDRQN